VADFPASISIPRKGHPDWEISEFAKAPSDKYGLRGRPLQLSYVLFYVVGVTNIANVKL